MDYYHYRKPYCNPGESESHYAIGAAALSAPFCLVVWFLLFWAIGIIPL